MARPVSRRSATVAAVAVVLSLGAAGCGRGAPPPDPIADPPAPPTVTTSATPAAPSATTATAAPLRQQQGTVPAGLQTITYAPAPGGFPADPTPFATDTPRTGVQPLTKVPMFDAPGGTARALLAPAILGVPLTLPVVDRRGDWRAVLVPSANRRIGWLAPQGLREVALEDLLVVDRSAHTMTWFRAGIRVATWRVTLGVARTPTPLGRTYVLGRSRLSGRVYAGLDVFALASVPENPGQLPTALRGAHIGVHAWHHDRNLGKNTSDGCIRLTRSGHARLLAEVEPGSVIVVVE